MKHKPMLTLPIKSEELPSLPACSDCEFSEMHEQNDRWFYCRRRSPVVGRMSNWPVVTENDWCGEYKKAKNV